MTTKCRFSRGGHITCESGTPRRVYEPKIGLRCDESTQESVERIAVGIDALATVAQRERARADFFEQALKWALGESPLPRDIEAERAAVAYLYALSLDGFGAFWLRFRRVAPLFARPIEWPTARTWHEPAMVWSEAVARLEVAAALRRAWRHVHAAQRRIVEGDAVAASRRLHAAMAVIGAGLDRQAEIRAAVLTGSEVAA